MPDYESLIDRERTPDGRFVVDVPDGTPTTDVACLTYPVLLERDQADLAVDGLLRGAMTQARILPVVLRYSGGHRDGHAGGSPLPAAVPYACRVCGACLLIVGPRVPRCSKPGHGTMARSRG